MVIWFLMTAATNVDINAINIVTLVKKVSAALVNLVSSIMSRSSNAKQIAVME